MMKVTAWAAGIGLLVQAVLVAMKLTGHVTWGWAAVLVPLELCVVAAAVALALGVWAVATSCGTGFDMGGPDDE